MKSALDSPWFWVLIGAFGNWLNGWFLVLAFVGGLSFAFGRAPQFLVDFVFGFFFFFWPLFGLAGSAAYLAPNRRKAVAFLAATAALVFNVAIVWILRSLSSEPARPLDESYAWGLAGHVLGVALSIYLALCIVWRNPDLAVGGASR